MFTGIVEGVGRVVAAEPHGARVRLRLETPPGLGEGVEPGDSVAVDGACLTVAEREGDRLAFDVVRETLDKTSLGRLRPGMRVNLERALRSGERFDGHIVQGHVDGTGRVRSLERRGDDVVLRVDCEPELAGLLVDKGSVAVDGVSLTVVDAEPEGFSVALVPHTLGRTTLGERRPGDPVNLEADILGKYVKRYLDRILSRSPEAGTP